MGRRSGGEESAALQLRDALLRGRDDAVEILFRMSAREEVDTLGYQRVNAPRDELVIEKIAMGTGRREMKTRERGERARSHRCIRTFEQSVEPRRQRVRGAIQALLQSRSLGRQ